MARVLLLVPSASYRAADFLLAATTLGVDVVVASPEAHAMQDVMGRRFLQLPLDDPGAAADAIVAHDQVAPLDAVVAVDDQGTVAAAVAAARLGLAHNPADAVIAARDKAEMRARLARSEVPQPASAVLPDTVAADSAADAMAGVGFPCVVKPTTLSGSQGVIRCDHRHELADVVRRVRSIARHAGCGSAPLLVEQFVPGVEVAIEGLLDGGELAVLAVFDKPDALDGPYFEETIYVTPSRLAPPDRYAAVAAAQAATRAVGLVDGPVHAEVRVHDGRAMVVEVAARTIGGLCARTLSFGTGRRLEALVLAHALGRPVDPTPDGAASGVLMLPIPAAGTFVGLDGRREALAVAGITAIETTIAPGRPVVPVPEGDRYLGFVFARGGDPALVEASLRRAQAALTVRIA